MNVDIGTEAAQFPEKEYINGIFLAVCNFIPATLHSIDRNSALNLRQYIKKYLFIFSVAYVSL
jgi:hypothetical protein